MNSNKLKNIITYTKNFNVLYIEDNLDVQFQTTKMLNSFFKKIELANNGKIALEIFEKEHFDLIITDIEMPLIDGISFIEIIRKKNRKIPIIVLSAYDDKEYFIKTINEGIDGYILKPYTLGQIASTLEKLIDKYDLKKKYNSKIKLINNFIWDKDLNQLSKENEIIKLSKYEKKLFELFITTNSHTKSYDEIEYFLFNNCEDNTKKLRIKLNCDLFETVYSFGYTLKFEEE